MTLKKGMVMDKEVKNSIFQDTAKTWRPGIKDNFKDIFENSPVALSELEGKLVEGVVIAIKDKIILVDLGLKMTIKYPLDELPKDYLVNLKVGSPIQFMIEQLETHDGEIVLNYEKAQKEIKERNIWNIIKKNREHVNGIVLNHVDGGYSVGLGGIVAFLPKDQVLPIKYKRKNKSSFVGSVKTFYVLNASSSKLRKNIIVSRTEAIKHMIRSKKLKELK